MLLASRLIVVSVTEVDHPDSPRNRRQKHLTKLSLESCSLNEPRCTHVTRSRCSVPPFPPWIRAANAEFHRVNAPLPTFLSVPRNYAAPVTLHQRRNTPATYIHTCCSMLDVQLAHRVSRSESVPTRASSKPDGGQLRTVAQLHTGGMFHDFWWRIEQALWQ